MFNKSMQGINNLETFHKIELNDSSIYYLKEFYSEAKATSYFNILLNSVPWQQDTIKVFGKIYDQPRLTCFYGDDQKTYSYSGITMKPLPFSEVIQKIKNDVEQISKSTFNAVLLNLYRNGNDSNGWHSDDEKELGKNPEIASLSLGAERVFRFRKKEDKTLTHNILLEHGSLLIMKGNTQHYWHHCIPKTKKKVSKRINLTFRFIY